MRFSLDCTLDQLQAKIDFLERKNSLLKSENEALELYAVKQKPELMNDCNNNHNYLLLITITTYYLLHDIIYYTSKHNGT